MALILVIDDDGLVRQTFRSVLESAGHEVREAKDGREGLIELRKQRPDLVITDILMPEQEGIETILAIRKTEADLPIIAISGGGHVASSDFLTTAKELGATLVLSKPIRNADLIAAVNGCLNPTPPT